MQIVLILAQTRTYYKMTKSNVFKYIKIGFKILGKLILFIAHLEIKLVKFMFSETRKVGDATRQAYREHDEY